MRSSRPGVSAAAWFAGFSATSASRPATRPAPSADDLRARLTDSAPIPTVEYRLHVRDRRGVVATQTFTTAFSRSLALLALVKQPVDLRVEDVTVSR